MFEYLKKYSRIIVSGSQRSGTTICARIISEDTGYRYIDENEYKIHNAGILRGILKKDKIVVHAPAMSHIIEKLADKNTLVVFMFRDIKEIIESQNRINWKGNENTELKKYGYDYKKECPPISKIKYEYWEKQKIKIKYFLEVEYESLKGHRLWIDKNKRKNFAIRQWEEK